MDIEILMIGDDRLSALQWRKFPGYNVRLISRHGIKMRELVAAVETNISDRTKIIIIVGFHYDLTEQCMLLDGRPGLLKSVNNPPFDELCNIVTTYDYIWRRQRGITVLWTLPYGCDFRLFNERRARLLNRGPICYFVKDEAIQSRERMNVNLKTLASKLRASQAQVLELPLTCLDISQESGSNGVNMAASSQSRVFNEVIGYAIALFPEPPPVEVAKVETLERRWQRKQLRRRRNRRRRAALKLYAASLRKTGDLDAAAPSEQYFRGEGM